MNRKWLVCSFTDTVAVKKITGYSLRVGNELKKNPNWDDTGRDAIDSQYIRCLSHFSVLSSPEPPSPTSFVNYLHVKLFFYKFKLRYNRCSIDEVIRVIKK